MSLLSFLLGLAIVAALCIFVRLFWVQLVITWIILRSIFWVSVASFFTAFVWMIFVKNYTSGPADDFWILWLFFFLCYSLIFVTGVFILTDAFNYFKGFIRDIFRK